MPEGKRYFTLNNQKIAIPTSQADLFLKDYPGAQEFALFNTGGKTPGAIPISSLQSFFDDNPNAQSFNPEDLSYYQSLLKPKTDFIPAGQASFNPIRESVNPFGADVPTTLKPEHKKVDSTGWGPVASELTNATQFTKDLINDAFVSVAQSADRVAKGIVDFTNDIVKNQNPILNPAHVGSPQLSQASKYLDSRIKELETGLSKNPTANTLGNVLGITAQIAASIASANPAASTGLFTSMGYSNGGEVYDAYKDSVGEQKDDTEKLAMQLLYAGLYAIPYNNIVRGLLPKTAIEETTKLVQNILTRNPEASIKTATDLLYKIAEKNGTTVPNILKSVLSHSTSSAANMAVMDLGMQMGNYLIMGEEKPFIDRLSEFGTSVGTGALIGGALAPYNGFLQNKANINRWKSQNMAAFTVDNNGNPVEILPNGKGLTPDGKYVEITEQMHDKAFGVPYSTIEKSISEFETGSAPTPKEREIVRYNAEMFANGVSNNGNITIATLKDGSRAYIKSIQGEEVLALDGNARKKTLKVGDIQSTEETTVGNFVDAKLNEWDLLNNPAKKLQYDAEQRIREESQTIQHIEKGNPTGVIVQAIDQDNNIYFVKSGNYKGTPTADNIVTLFNPQTNEVIPAPPGLIVEYKEIPAQDWFNVRIQEEMARLTNEQAAQNMQAQPIEPLQHETTPDQTTQQAQQPKTVTDGPATVNGIPADIKTLPNGMRVYSFDQNGGKITQMLKPDDVIEQAITSDNTHETQPTVELQEGEKILTAKSGNKEFQYLATPTERGYRIVDPQKPFGSQKSANAAIKLLEAKYPNLVFTAVDETDTTDDFAEGNFSIEAKKRPAQTKPEDMVLPSQKRINEVQQQIEQQKTEQRQAEVEQAAEIEANAEQLPVIEAKPTVKRPNAFIPKEAIQLSAREPLTTEEALLQYFVRGGRISKKDFKELTGWGSDHNDQHGRTELKQAQWMLSENGTPVDELINSIENPVVRVYIDKVGANAIQQAVQDIVMSYPTRQSMIERLRQLQEESGAIGEISEDQLNSELVTLAQAEQEEFEAYYNSIESLPTDEEITNIFDLTPQEYETFKNSIGTEDSGNNESNQPVEVGSDQEIAGQQQPIIQSDETQQGQSASGEDQAGTNDKPESIDQDRITQEVYAQQPELNPTEGQKEAGNYKKAHITVQGMDISIENPKGSVRSGTDEDGKAWETEMKNHYGYFTKTTGKDGDHIDTFVGENPDSQTVFVVDQVNPKTKEFDESKVMLGFDTIEQANAAYLSNYEPGWQGLGSITPVSVDEFKTWLYDGARQRKPFAEYVGTPAPEKPLEFVGDLLNNTNSQLGISISKYGWTANKLPDGTTQLINRNGKHAATITHKGSKYVISDTSGTKLLSGNNDVSTAAEKVIREYFYGKLNDDSGELLKPKNIQDYQEQLANGTITKTEYDKAVEKLRNDLKEGLISEPVEAYQKSPVVSGIGFYSTVENALSNISQNKGTPDQFKAMLLKNGAKQAELDWMGWNELADKQTLTKQDILNWIDQNRIEVHEVTKGGSNWVGNELIENGELLADVYQDDKGKWHYRSDFVEESPAFKTIQEAKANAEADVLGLNSKNDTKFDQYQLPGGENYKELLLTMPGKEELPTGYNVFQQENGYWGIEFPNGQQIGEWATRESAIRSQKSQKNNPNYQSTHWDESNILAHIRFNERTDTNGEKVLFVEEIQSDWAQHGKRQGFKDDYKKRSLVEPRYDGRYWYLYEKETGEMTSPKSFNSEAEAWKMVEQTTNLVSNAVPGMPFKKTDQWVNLALRRMMRYAAENGFDRIAWTKGEQQAERYDLSKSIKEVSLMSNGNGTYQLAAEDINGNDLYGNAGTQVKANEIENYVGKDIALKLIDGADRVRGSKWEKNMKYNPEFFRVFPKDLKVGGEGMKSFYDQIIPARAKELGKPFGASVEPIQVAISGGKPTQYADFNDYMDKKDSGVTTVLSIPVTEKMRETALNGLPLFEPPAEYIQQEIDFSYGSEQQRQQAIEQAYNQIVTEGDNPRVRTENALPKTYRSVPEDFKESGYVDVVGRKVTTPKDIADIFSIHRSPFIEKAHVVFIKNGEIVGTSAVTLNRSNQTMFLSPGEIASLYEKYGADEMYYMHNHPSGNYNVSKQDIFVTLFHSREFQAMASEGKSIKLSGHIVIDHEKFSFIPTNYEGQLASKDQMLNATNDIYENYIYQYEYTSNNKPLFRYREEIDGSNPVPRLAEIANALINQHSSTGAVIWLTPRLTISAWDVFPDGITNDQLINALKTGLKNNLGSNYIIVHDGSFVRSKMLPAGALDVINAKMVTSSSVATEKPYELSDKDRTVLWEDKSNYEFAGDLLKLPETIKVNGIDRPTTNSNGKPIAQTLQGVKNFYEWFGDSKVVDEQGRPLVVYHGTSSKFNKISLKKGTQGLFWFTSNKNQILNGEVGASGSGIVMELYAKINNPADWSQYDKLTLGQFSGYGLDGAILPDNDGSITGFIINSPSQIKSAIGNDGSFSPTNPNILKEPEFFGDLLNEPSSNYNKIPKANKQKPISGKLNVQGIDKLARGLFDKELDIKRALVDGIIKLGGKVPDQYNMYYQATRMQGLNRYEIDKYRNNVLTILDKAVAAIDLPIERVTRYLKAKSAIQRHEVEGIKAYSSDPSAPWNKYAVHEIVNTFESEVPLEKVVDLWNAVKENTDFTLYALFEKGVIYYDELAGRLARKFYVPLRGWKLTGDPKTDTDFYGYLDAESSYQKAMIATQGRSSESDDNVIAYIQSMAETAIMTGNKNQYKANIGKLYSINKNVPGIESIMMKKADVYEKLMKTSDDPDMALEWVEVTDKPTQKEIENGTARQRRGFDMFNRKTRPLPLNEYTVSFFVDGKKEIFEMDDPNVASAVNGTNNPAGEVLNWFLELEVPKLDWHPVKSWMWFMDIARKLNTQYNPEFVLLWNQFRDMFGVAPDYWVDGGSPATLIKNVPVAYKALTNWYRNTNTESVEYGYARDYFTKGGEITYANLDTIEKLGKSIGKRIKALKIDQTSPTRKQLRDLKRILVDGWDYLAKTSEISTRLAVFISDKQRGYSDEKAIHNSQRFSGNFARKGKYSDIVKPLHLFFNASMQGLYHKIRLARENPGKFASMFLGMAVFGFLSAALQSYLFGDERNKMRDFLKYGMLTIPNIFTKDKTDYFKTPLPYFWSWPYAMGATTYDLVSGNIDEEKFATYNTVQSINSLSPIPVDYNEKADYNLSESLKKSLLPHLLKPGSDIADNRDQFGNIIHRNRSRFEKAPVTPQAELGLKNTNQLLVWGARELNEAAGGTPTRSSAWKLNPKTGLMEYSWLNDELFNINPADIEYRTAFYAGGVGRILSNTSKVLTDIYNNESINVANIPGLRRWYGEITPQNSVGEYFDLKLDIENTRQIYNAAVKANDEQMLSLMRNNSRTMQLLDVDDELSRHIQELLDIAKTNDSEELKKELRAAQQNYIDTIKSIQQ